MAGGVEVVWATGSGACSIASVGCFWAVAGLGRTNAASWLIMAVKESHVVDQGGRLAPVASRARRRAASFACFGGIKPSAAPAKARRKSARGVNPC